MNIFECSGREFEEKLDELFKNKNSQELMEELKDCGLEINNDLTELKDTIKEIKDFYKDSFIECYAEDLPLCMFWNIKQANIVEKLLEEREQADKISSTLMSDFINKSVIPKSKIESEIRSLKASILAFEDLQTAGIETDCEYYLNIGHKIALNILEKLLKED